MYSSIYLNGLFVWGVTLIWFMLGYQLLLFFLGYRYFRQNTRIPKKNRVLDSDLPEMAVLVPCHNEEKVIVHTLDALLELDYPTEKLQIFIIDDGSSDRTASLVKPYCSDGRVCLLKVPHDRSARGKAAALNFGLKSVSQPFVAIYDADNQPERLALRRLAEELVLNPMLAATVGFYRVINRHRNTLTRFLNIEGIGFQWILQAGRWMLMRFVTLPGTNYIIRREVLASLGGWDENALTEDAELTVRVYQAGHIVKFIPSSVSWEQEPETWKVWFRQRHRWVRGHNHLLRKFASQLLHTKPRRVALEILYSFALYYIFFVAIVVSDLLFFLCLTDWILIDVPGPYTLVWVFALLTFILQLFIALSHAPGEDSLRNLFHIIVMYFTYCQVWIPLVALAFYDDFVVRKSFHWAKTERFDTT